MKNVASLVFILTALPLGPLTSSAAAYLQSEARFSPWVDARGNIVLPTGFRSRWVRLGSRSVAGTNGDTSFHDVYAQPGSEDPVDGPVVTIRNLSYTPGVIRVKPGQTITWVNRDDFAHTATADDESFDTGTMAPGESARIVFEETGTFSYHCRPHPFMKASVIVEE